MSFLSVSLRASFLAFGALALLMNPLLAQDPDNDLVPSTQPAMIKNAPAETPAPTFNPNQTPETRKALELEARAGVVLFFAGKGSPQPEDAGTFYIAKPDPSPAALDPATGKLNIGKLKALPMPNLTSFLRDLPPVDKALAVVVLGRSAQRWPEHVLIDATDRMVAAFKAASFARVVIEFDRGEQRSIYYDTDG